MLDASSRLVYLEELRPPAGYRLDRAIATTYSLDLLSLLMAPVSMALQDCASRDDLLKNPIAMLEAIRRTADRFVVFCQQGRTSVPKTVSRLYSYLERVVVNVQAPNPAGVFHPKTWLLRFAPEDTGEPVIYRFLCLSRNLTFDRSWDTVLALEGPLVDTRTRAIKANRPLGDFFAALPGLAMHAVSQEVQTQTALMAEEARRVRFDPPEDFYSEINFFPSGIEGYPKPPPLNQHRRLLVVSPFLSAEGLRPLTMLGEENVLISRLETLDALDDETIVDLTTTTELFVMDEAAERPEETEADAPAKLEDGTTPEDGSAEKSGDQDDAPAASALSGLHAKLYISMEGHHSFVLTGSANATSAARNGVNVEFLTGLWGGRKRMSIETFLGEQTDKNAFCHMIRPYSRTGSVAPQDTVGAKLADDLEGTRRALGRLAMSLQVRKGADETYEMELTCSGSAEKMPEGITGLCRPISLQAVDGRDVAALLRDGAVIFGGMSMTALTGFVAFELKGSRQGRTDSASFVLNLPVDGMPPERDRRILHEMIADRGRFIRYLLMLLDEEGHLSPAILMGAGGSSGNGDASHGLAGLPLLEELVRAFSRSPEKIGHIERLVADLQAAGEAEKLLPEGFADIWEAFRAAGNGREGR